MITRPAVTRSVSVLSDLSVIALLAAILYGLVRVAQYWRAPLQPEVDIHLSLWALPGYTLLSLLRGLVAYVISLFFALSYGYVAAHRPRAERVMLPLLDILQSIPVLGFLPGAVLALVALFPRTHVGLELASILMIFTGQVWNMTFSVYQSLRSVPVELREASALYRFNWWQRFRRVELPAAAVSLAWNSMMAMAGGWFFLMICEAFTLGEHAFRLPGLGAYISVAIARHDTGATLAGVAAMVLMIVLVDVCLWRPVLVWVQRFRIEDTATSEPQDSMVLSWLRRSRLAHAAIARLAHPISEWLTAAANVQPRPDAGSRRMTSPKRWLTALIVNGLVTGLAALGVLWAAGRLLDLLGHLPWQAWSTVMAGALWTSLRVMGAVVLGTLWTVPVGIWIGQSDRRRRRLQPLVQIAASFPAPMLYPLILLLLHQLGWGLSVGAVILMLVGTQWYILFNVIAGVSAVPDDLREAARSYHFTPRQRWTTLWWPGVFPYLVTGWVTAAGGAWNASIVAEYVAQGPQEISTAPGLGSLISAAASHGQYDLLAAGVLTMAVVVIAINRYVWKPLYRLAERRYAWA